MQLNSRESETIQLLRLPMCVAVVFLHAYATTQNISWLSEGRPLYQTFSYVFSLEFGEMAVPIFFIFAGFLFFYQASLTTKEYRRKIRSRFRSLAIPYFFWNLFFLLLFFVAEHTPFIASYFTGANKRISDYGGLDFLRAFWDIGSGVPFDWPLWFVRNLFCLCLAAPLIRWLIVNCRIGWVIFTAVLWYMESDMAFWASSLFFFSLGAWLSIEKQDLLWPGDRYFWLLVILSPLLFVADVLMRGWDYHLYIHRTAIITGIFFLINFTAYGVKKWKWKGKTYAGQLSFFLYVVHNPLINLVRKVSVKYFADASDGMLTLFYFADVAIVVGLITGIFFVMKRFFPRFLQFTVGR